MRLRSHERIQARDSARTQQRAQSPQNGHASNGAGIPAAARFARSRTPSHARRQFCPLSATPRSLTSPNVLSAGCIATLELYPRPSLASDRRSLPSSRLDTLSPPRHSLPA
eukprot:211016-Pleurochrysis_carterae.AAC.1